jgi:hypothetical protein
MAERIELPEESVQEVEDLMNVRHQERLSG